MTKTGCCHGDFEIKSDNPLVIVGTGGFALELAGVMSSSGAQIQGFVGPPPVRQLPFEWLGEDKVLASLGQTVRALVAVGDPAARRRINSELTCSGIKLHTFIHNSATVSSDINLQPGCIIYPNVTVHSGVVLDQGVLINSNATIGHETHVGSFSNISPGASIGGCCEIGDCCHIGIGAVIIENVKISPNCTIGAGAVVIRDTATQGTFVGCPAKLI